jgi:hypothetical protein
MFNNLAQLFNSALAVLLTTGSVTLIGLGLKIFAFCLKAIAIRDWAILTAAAAKRLRN